MRFRLRTLLLAVTATVILIIPVEFVFRGPRSVLMGYQYTMRLAFAKIEIGESETRARDIFGEPWTVEPNFPRAILNRESKFSSEELSKCVEFKTWCNGANWFYCFGIDENGKIVLKAEGAS